MPTVLKLQDIPEASLTRFAQRIALYLAPGDTLALEGELGAGKTTFARALIRALTDDARLEVVSPTFTLAQTYAAARFPVAHYDLYRLRSVDELDELGLDAALNNGIAILEWPGKAAGRLPENRFTLTILESEAAELRTVLLDASERLLPRAERLATVHCFLAHAGWTLNNSTICYLQGDASARRYARLRKDSGERAILMDSPRQGDGPPVRDGKPYSRIAHLAEDVLPFYAMSAALRSSGFSAPEIYSHDIDNGLLLLEDFGDAVFNAEVTRGANQNALWRRGIDTLAALRRAGLSQLLPLSDVSAYRIPDFDLPALMIECELLPDWYWPLLYGAPPPAEVRQDFISAWTSIAGRVLSQPKGLMLRDYHSPNLIALPDRTTPRDTGIIDFQDALLGPWAYDVVSLLQDARIDVAPDLERELMQDYIDTVKAADPEFSAAEFHFAYAALGAQRNTKILGIFARLAKRDGKRQYLAHIPRSWGYLDRSLSHPDLRDLKAWYDNYLPATSRGRTLNV